MWAPGRGQAAGRTQVSTADAAPGGALTGRDGRAGDGGRARPLSGANPFLPSISKPHSSPRPAGARRCLGALPVATGWEVGERGAVWHVVGPPGKGQAERGCVPGHAAEPWRASWEREWTAPVL